MENTLGLDGKNILVTGASSGIGRETAIYLSQMGAKLTIVARRQDKMLETIHAMEGADNQYYVCDLADVEGINSFMKQVLVERGAFDGFVGCAGVASSRPLNLLSYGYMQEIMNINFFSFVEMVRVLSKKKAHNEGFSIVGISSISSFQGIITETAYASSKGAMNMAVRCLSRELGKCGVRINALAPGFIGDTDIGKSIQKSDNQIQYLKKLMDKQTLGMGKAVDVAKVVAFLLSDMASFITGTIIPVDGGNLA